MDLGPGLGKHTRNWFSHSVDISLQISQGQGLPLTGARSPAIISRELEETGLHRAFPNTPSLCHLVFSFLKTFLSTSDMVTGAGEWSAGLTMVWKLKKKNTHAEIMWHYLNFEYSSLYSQMCSSQWLCELARQEENDRMWKIEEEQRSSSFPCSPTPLSSSYWHRRETTCPESHRLPSDLPTQTRLLPVETISRQAEKQVTHVFKYVD